MQAAHDGADGHAEGAGGFLGAEPVDVDELLTTVGLVVKLPRGRVDSLIANGSGMPFDAGKGRPMKEWLTVATDDAETWLILAREALEFVGAPSGQ